MKLFKKIFSRRKSANVVKKRLKEVIAGDRLSVAPSVMERIQTSIRDILTGEMGVNGEEMLFAVVSKREGTCTELTVNVSFTSQGIKAPIAS